MTDIAERLHRDLMEISYDDIEAMVREAAGEIERLTADGKYWREQTETCLARVEPLRAENERLRTENSCLGDILNANQQLRAALQQIMGRYELEEEGWPAAEDMREIARRALEPKP